jgi:hypothetical protein
VGFIIGLQMSRADKGNSSFVVVHG